MDNINLSEEAGCLIFRYNQKDGEEIYSIPFESYCNTHKYGKSNVSGWISQLSSKIWITSNLLYRVAKVIQNRFPENEIDWVMTFFIFEKGDYLDKYVHLKSEFDGGLTKSDDFMTRVKIGQQENVQEVNDNIIETVKRNLRQMGIT